VALVLIAKSLVSIPKTLISENRDIHQVHFDDEISSQYPKNSDFRKWGYSSGSF